ncbi:MAG: prolipoprotein diacylglyceryl transferase [Eubacteriales bacterium]
MIDPIAVNNLFGIQGLHIAWYGIIIAVGIVLGVWVAIREAKRKGYSAELLFDFMIIALPLAIVCARIYYVATSWSMYAGNFYKMIAIWEGGIAIYGAVIGGIIAALIVAKWRKFPVLRLLDIAAPGLILGQAIGRWGNFVNQEAFGNVINNPSLQFWPYGVFIQKLGEWHQATYFYESMWDLGTFIWLLVYARRAKYDGNVIAMYFITYGIGRFFIEGMRTDSLYVGPFRISQLLSVVFVVGGIIYILVRRKKKKEDPIYHGHYTLSNEAAEQK